MEQEIYDALFFYTPVGEDSVVKLITNTLDGRELEMPRPLRIVLRAFNIEGVNLPVYCLDSTFMVMLDGSKGGANLFDGAYTNTYDGTTFESDYVRIEPDGNGGLNVTVKKDQPIWPEWTGDNSAEDICGNRFVQIDGMWYNTDKAAPETLLEDARAA